MPVKYMRHRNNRTESFVETNYALISKEWLSFIGLLTAAFNDGLREHQRQHKIGSLRQRR